MFGEYLRGHTLVVSFFLSLAYFYLTGKRKKVIVKFPNPDSDTSAALSDSNGCYQLKRTYLPCDGTASPHP